MHGDGENMEMCVRTLCLALHPRKPCPIEPCGEWPAAVASTHLPSSITQHLLYLLDHRIIIIIHNTSMVPKPSVADFTSSGKCVLKRLHIIR